MRRRGWPSGREWHALVLVALPMLLLVVQAAVGPGRRGAAQPLPTAPPTFEVPTLPPDIPTPMRYTATPTSAFSPTPTGTPSPTLAPTDEPTDPAPLETPTVTELPPTLTPTPSVTPGPTTWRLLLPRVLRQGTP